MHSKRMLAALAALMAVMLLLSGCGGNVRRTVNGLSITLPEEFKSVYINGYDVCFTTDEALITGIKQSFGGDVNLKSLSVKDYAELVMNANGADGEVKEDKGFAYYEYVQEYGSETKNKYLACCYKTDDAFWFVRLGCEEADYEEMRPSLLKWARTVGFNG